MEKEIKVVNTQDSKKFEDEVNTLLKEGWVLHGETVISKVPQMDSWGDRKRAWIVQFYTQVLKR